jgi:hypothetical protein
MEVLTVKKKSRGEMLWRLTYVGQEIIKRKKLLGLRLRNNQEEKVVGA